MIKNKLKKIIANLMNPPIKLAGLDIGKSYIKIMEIEGETLATAKVTHYAIEPIPEEIIKYDNSERDINEIENIGAIIKKCWKKSGISTKNMVVSLPNISVIDRKQELEVLDEDDSIMLHIVGRQMSNHLPTDMTEEDVVLDYAIRNKEHRGVDNVNEVLMLAGKKNQIDEITSMVEAAGLTPYILDVEKYAIENLIHLMKKKDFNNKTYLLLDTSFDVMRIMIWRDGEIVANKDTEFGGRNFNESIMRHFNVDYLTAETMKKERDSAEYLNLEEEFLNDYVRQVLVNFDYISSAIPGALEVDEFIVIGGVASTPNFLTKLENAIKLDEQTSIKTAPYIARPLEKMEKSSKINQEKFHQDESKLFLVTSLALRQFLRNY